MIWDWILNTNLSPDSFSTIVLILHSHFLVPFPKLAKVKNVNTLDGKLSKLLRIKLVKYTVHIDSWTLRLWTIQTKRVLWVSYRLSKLQNNSCPFLAIGNVKQGFKTLFCEFVGVTFAKASRLQNRGCVMLLVSDFGTRKSP